MGVCARVACARVHPRLCRRGGVRDRAQRECSVLEVAGSNARQRPDPQARAKDSKHGLHTYALTTILAAREAPPPRTRSAVSRVHWLARVRLPFGGWCTAAGNHEGQVTCLAVVSDDMVFSGSDEFRIKVWGRALCE